MIPQVRTKKIDWGRIARAVDFYKSKGFSYVEVPWMVDDRFVQVTYPDDCPQESCFQTPKGTLVGSAEQSFLAFVSGGYGEYGSKKLVAVTPCFRDHQPDDEFHQPWFMKVELYSEELYFRADELMRLAGEFFVSEGVSLTLEETEIGFDWKVGDIEIGSYGNRLWSNTKHNKIAWSYGTGLAEPRFSQALDKQKKFIRDRLFDSLRTKTENMDK